MDKLLLQYKSTQSQQQEHEAAAAAQSIPADTQAVSGDINSVQQVLQQAAAQVSLSQHAHMQRTSAAG